MLKTKVTKLPKSEVEIEGTLDAEAFEAYFNPALKILGEKVKIDGFRPGKIPEAVLQKNIPEMNILEKMAELALNEYYPKIIAGETGSEKIDAISQPQISITKIARKNPLEFKIKTAILPEIKLGDYKKSSKKVLSEVTDAEKNIVVSDEDLNNTIEDIRKSRAPRKHVSEIAATDPDKEKPEELPEFNDDFVRTLGPFKDVADFKEKLKVNIKLEKENAQKEKTRLKIIEKIIEDSTIDVPEILIDVEIDKILFRMQSDITSMGLKFEDYLKHMNKTIEDLRTEFRADAEKRAKLGLILNEIARIEKIVPDEAQVEKEIAAIMEHYTDADPDRARAHAENVLMNEAIFKFLENQ